MAREHLDRIGRTSGQTRTNVELRLAELALATGDLDGARAAIDEAERLLVDSLEPQFVAVAGVLRAELERRDGGLDDARERSRPRWSASSTAATTRCASGACRSTGLAVEADAAQRARDLADRDAEAAAIARAEVMLSRARAAADDAGPDRAGAARERRGATSCAPPAQPAVEAWRAASDAWAGLERPLPAAIARWRAAESALSRADRETARPTPRAGLATRAPLGRGVAHRRARGAGRPRRGWPMARRRRLRGGRQRRRTRRPARTTPTRSGSRRASGRCSGSWRAGATNREIGAELYMAEKTASVHVSRILSKLDVRSRTEAAAVAHRLGLAERP